MSSFHGKITSSVSVLNLTVALRASTLASCLTGKSFVCGVGHVDS